MRRFYAQASPGRTEVLFNNSSSKLFNENIELGSLQITVPPCNVFPTLEQLELVEDKSKPIEVVLKAIDSSSYFSGRYLDFVNKK
jgi:hypothetical protein